MRRVVITGIGAVSCLGNSWNETWNHLTAGRNGFGPITLFDPAGLPNVAGEVRSLVLKNTTPKEERRMARYIRFAVAASDEALEQAGLSRSGGVYGGDPFRFGVLIGSATGGVDEYEKHFEMLNRRGPGGVSAFFIPKFMVNGASGMVAERYGLRGPNFNPVTACASGSHALGEAMRIIKRGDADLMLAGGAEASLTKLMMSGFNSLTALSSTVCRPFDLNRDGFIFSEGAAVMVLEEQEHAKKRGAEILAEIAGYGATCDAYHITAPDPEAEGVVRAMREAMKMAGCPPETVGCISAHGTGTVANDRAESKAILKTFGSQAEKIKVSALKSMLGHPLAAGGALAAAAAVGTLREGIVPPTINYETPDPECPLDVTANHAAEIKTEAVMTNSMGFGGHNAVVILQRWKG